MKFVPYEYQRRAIAFVKAHKEAGLFLGCGLGKSVVTLTAVRELVDECEVDRVLVVAPKKVAESTWAAEAEKWDHLRGLRVSLVLGDARRRAAALRAEAEVYVTSRDLFAWVAAQKPWRFDMLVLDELTSFKNSASVRFKALRRVRRKTERVVGLTGTPAPNGLKDLWAQMWCLDMGRALGPFKGRFLDTYFDTFRRNNIPLRITPRPGAEEAIFAKIAPEVLTMKAEDWLELPPMLERTVPVRLSEEVMGRYRAFERERVLFASERLREDGSPSVVAANAAALCNKLCQFASGAVYDDEGAAMEVHGEMMEALMELLESAAAGGEHVLVFYQFRHEWERFEPLGRRAGWRVRKYEDDADLRAWNAGEVDVLFAHPASTSYGLNMQAGGHVAVWLGTGFNAELYVQGNARLHRQGQKEPTRVYGLVAAGTAMEYAAGVVAGKVDAQDAMINFLKSKIHEEEVREHHE